MKCVICAADTNIIKKDTYSCTKCNHIFRNYFGDSIKFHKEVYRHKDKKQWQRNNKEINIDGSINSKVFHKARAILVYNRIKKIKNFLEKGTSILDVGSGAGTFALALKAYTDSIECLEIADSLIDESVRLGFKTYKKDFLEQEFEKKYDIVTCFHVLEHVKDAKSFIKKISEITNEYCIVEIPTLKCFFNETKKLRGMPPPNNESYDGHYHYFTPESLRHIMEPYFKVIRLESGVQSPAILIVGEKK